MIAIVILVTKQYFIKLCTVECQRIDCYNGLPCNTATWPNIRSRIATDNVCYIEVQDVDFCNRPTISTAIYSNFRSFNVEIPLTQTPSVPWVDAHLLLISMKRGRSTTQSSASCYDWASWSLYPLRV